MNEWGALRVVETEARAETESHGCGETGGVARGHDLLVQEAGELTDAAIKLDGNVRVAIQRCRGMPLVLLDLAEQIACLAEASER